VLHLVETFAVFVPSYGAIALGFARGSGLRQMLADVRPAWTRRAEPAE